MQAIGRYGNESNDVIMSSVVDIDETLSVDKRLLANYQT